MGILKNLSHLHNSHKGSLKTPPTTYFGPPQKNVSGVGFFGNRSKKNGPEEGSHRMSGGFGGSKLGGF